METLCLIEFYEQQKRKNVTTFRMRIIHGV